MSRGFVAGVVCCSLGWLGSVGPLSAQDADPDPVQLLDDFAHYVTVANFDLAEANARALIDRALGPAAFLAIVEDEPRLIERFESAYARAIRIESLEDEAAELMTLYEEGRRSRARSPIEIEKNIELLDGNARARRIARERLLEAKEYAVPQLLEALRFNQSSIVRAEAERVLVDMGAGAVEPLIASLLGVEPQTQETVATVLGGIGYPRALPFLYELRATSDHEPVRRSAERAIGRIQEFDPAQPIAALYRLMGEAYYSESASVTSFPGEEFQLLWDYEPENGLIPTAVLSEVYHEARAMRMARKALELDPQEELAHALWVRANFSREIDQPPTYDNPAYPADQRDAMYWAVGAGSTTVQRVLARGIADRDTPLVRLSIEALSRSTGGATLWRGLGERRPLLDALAYPDRRVRYDAALVLAGANPRESFRGHERVVPVLGSAVRHAGDRFALVVALDEADRQDLQRGLESGGWTVLAPTASLIEASPRIAEAPGVDVIVSAMPADASVSLVAEARRDARLTATPVILFVRDKAVVRVSGEVGDDRLVRVSERSAADAVGTIAEDVVERASGQPFDDRQAEVYALRSLEALRSLAIARNELLRADDAARLLVASLPQSEGEVRRGIAGVLGQIGQERAQTALVREATASGDEFDRVLMLEAAAESAKRYGNLLDQRDIASIREIAQTGSDAEATAAAALLGALNLPAAQLVPLLP